MSKLQGVLHIFIVFCSSVLIFWIVSSHHSYCFLATWSQNFAKNLLNGDLVGYALDRLHDREAWWWFLAMRCWLLIWNLFFIFKTFFRIPVWHSKKKHFMIEYPQLFLCSVTAVSNLAISAIRLITKSWEAFKNVTPPPTLHLRNFVSGQNFPSLEERRRIVINQFSVSCVQSYRAHYCLTPHFILKRYHINCFETDRRLPQDINYSWFSPADKMIMEVWAAAMSVSSIYASSPNFPVMASGGEALHKMCRSHGQNHSSKDFLFTPTGQEQFNKSKHKYNSRPQNEIWNYFAISCH